MLANCLCGSLHGAQRMGTEIVRRGGQRQYAGHTTAGITDRSCGALPVTFTQRDFPVFSAEYIDQPLLAQAARGAVGAEHLLTQDAADRSQVAAAKTQYDALRICEIDMTVGIVSQQVLHHAMRHSNQLTVMTQNGGQLRWIGGTVLKRYRIDAMFVRAVP